MQNFGRFQIAAVDGGSFALDGGAMFGIVPRPLWEKQVRPDARNRITLATRCLLVVDNSAATRRVILVDSGIGDKFPDKEKEIFDIQLPEGGLKGSLARLGFAPEDVTDLVITHLHFDHVGGATERDKDGVYRPTFPNATVHVQRRMWKWAEHPTEKDAGSFRPDTYEALAGKLHLLDGPTEIVPDFGLIVSEGHTVGQQLPLIDGGEDGKMLYCGDVVPTRAHIRLPWIMGYDLYPLTTLEEKKLLLAQALDESWILFFEHDFDVPACRLTERNGTAVAGETYPVD
ncbi:MAG: MBL fold metallo-hydrolase [Myxococcota bacterium]